MAARRAPWEECAVLVLAGGGARRMGRDKLAEPLDRSVTVLDAVLAGVPYDVPVVVVGPHRETERSVLVAREDPPGAGPVAGVAAGLARLDDGAGLVVLLAGDAPFAPAAVPALLTAVRRDPSAEVAVAQTPDGHVQPLLAVYRAAALARSLSADPRPRAARALMDGLAVVRVPVAAEAALDVDTPADLEAARRSARGRLRS